MIHVNEQLRQDKRFNKLYDRIERCKIAKKTVVKRSMKWVAALFAECLIVQLLSFIGVPVFESVFAMLVIVALGAALIYEALRESKDYKALKTKQRDAEYKLRRYCSDAQ